MHLLILLLSLSLVQSENQDSTQDAIKAKRGITLLPTGALIGGPNYKPSLFYADTAPSASAAVYSNPKALYTIQQNTQIKPVLIPEPHKPFIYDQYPPHDQSETQPNLSETTQPHVIYNHHQYQPQRPNHLTNNPINLQAQPNQYHTAQAVANPIQHSTYIHHTPYTIPGGSPQARYYSAGKMLYNNQNYQQSQLKPHPTHALSYQRVQFPQKAPIHYHYQQHRNNHPNLKNVTPIQFRHQQSHHEYRKPESQKEDVEDEYDEEKDLERQQEAEEDEDEGGVEEKEELREDEEEAQEAEEEDEGPVKYRNNEEQEHKQEDEEEEEEHNPFSKYQALDVPEHENYGEEAAAEDEDSDKGSSYHVPKNKKSQKYHSKAPKYDYYDKFHYKPSGKHVIKMKPVKPVKNYSTKIESKFGGHKSNQKKLDNNSKQSQKVPIAVHKFYKEKWYLAKEDIK